MRKRHLCQSKHPFDADPFEAFYSGSWKAVELIRIEDGTMTLQFVDGGFLTAKKSPFTELRIRSRKAALSDCTCFLRPGVDICVLSTSQTAEHLDEDTKLPAWLDAKVNSIERKPHDSGCKCKFFINFYTADESLGSENRTLNKEVSTVEIDQIAILQKLERYPSENEHYRWKFSEDCSLVQRTKLLLGKILSDLSWLLVVSALKLIAFDVRSVQNKIIYQILGGNHDKLSSVSEKRFNAITFQVDNGISIPRVVPVPAEIVQADSVHETGETGPEPFYNLMNLRRSKRRYVQPERYFSEGSLLDSELGLVRAEPYRLRQGELPLILINQADEHIDTGRVQSVEKSHEDYLFCGDNKSSREGSPSLDGQEHQNQLALVPVSMESYPSPITQEHGCLQVEICERETPEIGDIVSKYISLNDSPKIRGKSNSGLEGTDDGEIGWVGNVSNAKVKRSRVYSKSSIKRSFYDDKTYKKRPPSLVGYNEMIKTYMKNIESTIKKEEPNIIDQWKEFQSMKSLAQRPSGTTVLEEDVEEISETDMLWREMELAIASTYLIEDEEDSDLESKSLRERTKSGGQICPHDYRLDEEIGILCKLCGSVLTEIKAVLPTFAEPMGGRSCEIEAPLTENMPCHEEVSEQKLTEDESLNFFFNPASEDSPLSESEDNVWTLIPDLKDKLRFHQKKAFEFLWQNIAGSLEPAQMESAAKRRGGCVISHSPGAGKTLLIIAFLLSYLKLFPGKRPLVLAPKTTLYTWYKEIIKWEVPIPVYRIHGCRTYRYERSNKVEGSLGEKRLGGDIMHALDCLEKIRMWHSHPSILLMGYTSFLSLTREDSKLAHRKYMSEVLRESPGILVLDEGHNPRSTKSRLRKALMKVKTELRVLLSGTLFQNNFGEYFNTLSLARPTFIKEVLRELDPNFRKKKKGLKKTQFAIENRARKFFIDTIASKFNSSEPEERLEGLNLLRSMTAGFIDVYEGSSSDNLPGLQCYTLLMKPTKMQQEILLKLHSIMATYNGYPLELELLITLGSIHPWLIKTAACVSKFFRMEEVEALEKYKFELNRGTKVKFVVSLVHRAIMKNEKVLIFCHNIAPMSLFLEIFGWLYGWRRNEEILVLEGAQELYERGRVMEKFEDPFGTSRILLASISACAEGISLTAASRVILLDTEWNPSKRKQAIARAFRPGQERMVYVYQLLVTGTLEENKYGRTTYKEWVSSMIFSEELVEDPSCWQAEKIEDDLLREIVEEDHARSFHMIMKNEKDSNTMIRGREIAV